MANANLKDALQRAGLTPEQFADIIQVDPKTVQRWVAGTTVPYRRHRAAISRALDLPEHRLWSDEVAGCIDDDARAEAASNGCDVTGTWARADDEGAPNLAKFINDTTGPIDILDSSCRLQITAEVTGALLKQAAGGRPVRILTDGRAPHWEPLLTNPEIKLCLAEIPGEYWLIKTPDRMLVAINLEEQPAEAPLPPILELAPTTGEGLFHRLTQRFEALWELTSETGPIESAEVSGSHTTADSAKSESASGTTSRRWPRQPG